MALCHDCNDTREEKVGTGGQNDFTFAISYNNIEDIKVAFWDDSLNEYVPVTSGWIYLNANTIRFDDPAPALQQKFIIYRCTNLEGNENFAVFAPGTSIKAGDLNNNFNALKFAVQEAACEGGSGGGGGGSVGDALTLSSLRSNSPITIEQNTFNNTATFRINLLTLDER